MQKFGKLIDDIRETIPDIIVSFDTTNLYEQMEIRVPNKTRTYRIDTQHIGVIDYNNTDMYNELLKITIDTLNNFMYN